MKLNISPNQLKMLMKIGLFFVVTAIIVELFPRQNNFKFHFDEGKPWSYELVTASFDFPIYKSDLQINTERNEALRNFSPYFKVDTAISINSFEHLMSNLHRKGNVPFIHLGYLKAKFNDIYKHGVISIEWYNKLKSTGKTEIWGILPNRISRSMHVDDLYTPKSAYEEITRNLTDTLSGYNLNLYLVPNLVYDSATSEMAKAELLKNISLTMGMVQTGERIIDRGEIVTPHLYQVLNSLKIEFDRRKSSIQQSSIVIIGEIFIVLALVSLFFLYIYLFRPRIFESFSNLIFISLLVILIVALTSFTLFNATLSYYMVPFALLPIIIRVFFDSRTALFGHIITILIISLIVDNPFQFIILQITVGMVAVSSLKDMTQRSQLAQTALYIFLSYSIVFLSFEFITEGDISRIHWPLFIPFAVSSLFLLFAYVLIYIFEKIFGLISSITLVELTNINSDLMMKFAEAAPGTFQHTLQVSNLSTEAAKKIGANSLLVRTGALYHDIGKMRHPEYFIENQMGNENPLSEMNFEEAAKIVISHVEDGIQIAKKSRLPEQIINFIRTHHGISKAKYFYNSFINANPGVMPNEEAFTYQGPLPNTKETAILMMADVVEARSRSLSVYTVENISEIVESTIDGQIAEGQFKEAPITFRDVETVKNVFKEKIKSIYHNRIVYPELKQNKVSDKVKD
jgi:putative nucleotidyltransferase with HDIG domain